MIGQGNPNLPSYSEKYNCIFVRIPRCATSSICKALDITGDHHPYSELQLMLPKSILKKAVVFTVARNPWDRVVSLFKFRMSKGHDTLFFKEFEKLNKKITMIDWLKNDNIVHSSLSRIYFWLQQFPYWSVGRPGRGSGIAENVHYVINYDHLELAWKKYLPKILGVSNLPDLHKINTSQQIFNSGTPPGKENLNWEDIRGGDGTFPNYTKFYANQEEIDYVGNLFRTEVSWFNWKFGVTQDWVYYGGKKLPPPMGSLEGDLKDNNNFKFVTFSESDMIKCYCCKNLMSKYTKLTALIGTSEPPRLVQFPNVWKCKECKHIFRNYMGDEDLTKYYTEDYRLTHPLYSPEKRDMYLDAVVDFMEDSWSKKKIVDDTYGSYWIKEINISSLLELGAADGQLTKVLSYKFGIDSSNVSVCEISDQYCDMLEDEGFDVHRGNFLNIDFKINYDLIVAIDVIEHIKDVSIIPQKFLDLTSDNGRVLLQVPYKRESAKTDPNVSWDGHFHYFTEDSIRALFENYFIIENIYETSPGESANGKEIIVLLRRK